MIQVEVDWPAVIDALHRRGLRDKDIFDAMANQGVVAHHDALRALRTGNIASPRYAVGAALMNLYEERNEDPNVVRAPGTHDQSRRG